MVHLAGPSKMLLRKLVLLGLVERVWMDTKVVSTNPFLALRIVKWIEGAKVYVFVAFSSRVTPSGLYTIRGVKTSKLKHFTYRYSEYHK